MSGKSLDETTLKPEGNDFGSSSNKRMKEMSIDRLSALPDSLVIHILSFLGVKVSAVTSVLSKRWKFIWTELPELSFIEYSMGREKRRHFAEMVSRTLFIRTGIHLEKFDVHFRYNGSFASYIDSWFDFVLKHTVKEVGLRLYPRLRGFSPCDAVEEAALYSLPETMYSNSSLKRFSMGRCRLVTLTNIEWQSLISLYINNSELTQHVVENILSGCPVLHTLELKGCWGFSCLEVKFRNLHELMIHDEEFTKNRSLLEISAPYVRTLDIRFNPGRRKLVLRNIESIVRAKIDFCGPWYPATKEDVASLTKELYEIVLHLEEVELGRVYYQVLSKLVANDGWQLPLSRRKCLTIHTSAKEEHNISGIFALLNFSPNLEKLAIEGFQPEGETWYDAVTDDLDCDLLHLKSVRMIEFANPFLGGEPMLKVAQTLLKRATVLEEMTVRLKVEDIDDYIEIGETLFSYPRSSEKAVIEFHDVILQLCCRR